MFKQKSLQNQIDALIRENSSLKAQACAYAAEATALEHQLDEMRSLLKEKIRSMADEIDNARLEGIYEKLKNKENKTMLTEDETHFLQKKHHITL